MPEDILKTSVTENLNAGDIENHPVCPMNPNIPLESVGKEYRYRRLNPDTRWFRCPECDCKIGYHRMNKSWRVDPYDLDFNDKLRNCFGLPPVADLSEDIELPDEIAKE